ASASRATAAYNAMQQSLYVADGRGLYRETATPASATAYVWPFSRARGLSTQLDRPKQLFSFARRGWDRVATDPHSGGLFWVQQGVGFGLSNHDRGAGPN